MKRCAVLVLGMVISTLVVHGQSLRVTSLGSMRYAVEDPQSSLSLYTFGGNPAWLINHERQGWLTFTPQANALWGEYRRLFDPGRVMTYGAGFEGVKPLDDRGTFRGYSSYIVEERSDVYRSIKRTPYGGEAYFLADSTTGSFTYKGPTIAFSYAYELFSGLFAGATLGYTVQDGLKDFYTMPKSLFRRVDGVVGVAYAVDSALAIGLTFRPVDEQERLEAKSDDLLDVELFNFRGETYAKRRSSSSIQHSVRLTGEEYGGQLHWALADGMQLAVGVSAGITRTRDEISTAYEEDFEDGFAQRTWYSGETRLRWAMTEDATVGCGVAYHHQREWSRYTALDLLLWDSKGSETTLGAGGSHRLSEDGATVACELDYAFVHADSSKYIDSRYAQIRTSEYRLRVGMEYPLTESVMLRGSYGYGGMGLDVRTGGSSVHGHTAILSVALPLGGAIYLEWLVRYSHRDIESGAARNDFGAVALIRIADL
ncbi:MAG: hypothetical protein H6Q31_279 [Bacteroidetes bacterium]|nr:hypothetical protein [Bacteroidota bacterium]